MFEAAPINVTDGTHPCLPFLLPDFKDLERTVMMKFIKNDCLTHYSILIYSN